MKVSDLEGVRLDYWVARADGYADGTVSEAAEALDGESDPRIFTTSAGNLRIARKDTVAAWAPSTDWAQGGPLLARMVESGEYCVWEYDGVVTVSNRDPECTPNKRLENGELDWEGESVLGEGPTLLIAAMRAFVSSKYGEEVKD
jgi:hypothetical protein